MVNYNTTYIPAKMEKGQTMAYNYYNLFILRGVVVSNEWASVTSRAKDLASETTIYVDASNIPRDVEGKAIGSTSGDYFTLPNYKAPVELLGHEVIVYARYANNYTTRPFDKVYGEMVQTDRSKETVKYARKTVTGALSAASAETNLNYYVTNSDYGMDATYANVVVSGITRLLVDYSVKGYGDSVNIKQGSPIKFIDNNNDGVYDFIIASNMTYAKVTNVADDGKVTAVAGSIDTGDFNATAILSGKAAADIYLGYNEAKTERSEALKVDDRILVYPLGGKFGIMPVKAMVGTLTATNGRGIDDARATISGKTYRNSLFESAISDLEGTAVSANFGVEKDWRFFGTYLLEGPDVAGTSTQYALVLDSWANGNSNFSNFTKQVRLLLADGTNKVYDLTAIYNHAEDTSRSIIISTGTSNKIAVDMNKDGDSSDAGDYTFEDLLATPKLNTNDYNIFRAAVSEDGKSVTLYEPKQTSGGAQGELSLGTNGAHYYKTGGATITIADGSKRNVLNNTAFFVINKTAKKAGVYTGRNLPTFTGADTSARAVMATISGGQDPADSYIRAAVYLTNNIDVATYIGQKYAYVMATPNVIYDNAANKYYAELSLYDGKEVKTYTTILGLKANTDAYTTDLIQSTKDGLDPVGTLGVNSGHVVEYTLNADGKINSLVRVTNFTNTSKAASFGVSEGLYDGYYLVGGSGWIKFWYTDSGASVGTMAQHVDAEFYNMTASTGTPAATWPATSGNIAKKAKILLVDGLVVGVWVNTANAGWDTSGTTNNQQQAGPTAIAGLPSGTFSIVGTTPTSAGQLWYNSLRGELVYHDGVQAVTVTNAMSAADKAFFAVLANPDTITVASGKVNAVTTNIGKTLALTSDFVDSTLTVGNGVNGVALTGTISGTDVDITGAAGANTINVSGLTANSIKLSGAITTAVVNATAKNIIVSNVGSTLAADAVTAANIEIRQAGAVALHTNSVISGAITVTCADGGVTSVDAKTNALVFNLAGSTPRSVGLVAAGSVSVQGTNSSPALTLSAGTPSALTMTIAGGNVDLKTATTTNIDLVIGSGANTVLTAANTVKSLTLQKNYTMDGALTVSGALNTGAYTLTTAASGALALGSSITGNISLEGTATLTTIGASATFNGSVIKNSSGGLTLTNVIDGTYDVEINDKTSLTWSSARNPANITLSDDVTFPTAIKSITGTLTINDDVSLTLAGGESVGALVINGHDNAGTTDPSMLTLLVSNAITVRGTTSINNGSDLTLAAHDSTVVFNGLVTGSVGATIVGNATAATNTATGTGLTNVYATGNGASQAAMAANKTYAWVNTNSNTSGEYAWVSTT